MDARASTALVTGGAGFIGSELVTQLHARGHRVRVLDDLSAGRRENLAHLAAGTVELIEGDVRDASLVRSLCNRAGVVFHLACVNLRRALGEPRRAHEVNTEGTITLLEAALAAGVPRFVHVSSCEVYGSAITVPMDEHHPTSPTTIYGASKLAGEAYARAFRTSYGLPVTVVRPFNAYGRRCHLSGDGSEVIPRFLMRCLADLPLRVFGDGTQTRDFTEVSDTARGILLAGEVAGIEGATFNLGSGRDRSMNDVAHMVGHVCERPVAIEHGPPRPGDLRRLCADSRRAARLGWTPRVDFAIGLRQLMAWVATQPSFRADGGAATGAAARNFVLPDSPGR